MAITHYKEAAENLIGPLESDCGLAEVDVESAESRLQTRLPAALRDYYLAIGKLKLNAAHNRLLPPSRWFCDSGKMAFMVENQGVVYWGVEAEERTKPDPPVFQGTNLLPNPIEWHPEHDRCSEFLLVMIHLQAVWGTFGWAGQADVGPEILHHLEKQWQRVGHVAGLTAFCREGQAACVIDGGKTLDLYVGGRTESLFEQIEQELEAIGVGLNHL